MQFSQSIRGQSVEIHDSFSMDDGCGDYSSTQVSLATSTTNETNPNKTKDFDLRQAHSVVYQRSRVAYFAKMSKTLLFFLLFMSANLPAQERTVDATWLHRYVPSLNETKVDLSTGACHYKAIFGTGDTDNQILRSVSHFGEVTVDAHGNCQSVLYDREEEIYFVLQGAGALQYADGTHHLRANDFTYVPPTVKHGLANDTNQSMRVLVMGFKIPQRVTISAPSQQPRIVNLDDVKEETVQGHPTSVLYKLLIGPRSGKARCDRRGLRRDEFLLDELRPGGNKLPTSPRDC